MLDNNPDNVEDNFEKKFEENSEENKNNSINEAVDSLIESPDELQEIKDTTQLIDSEVSLTIKNTEFSESIEEIEVKAAVEAEDVKIVVKEIKDMLDSYGGYLEVVEKTVKFYIEKTGEWKLNGDDKYCKDAKLIADKILKKPN